MYSKTELMFVLLKYLLYPKTLHSNVWAYFPEYDQKPQWYHEPKTQLQLRGLSQIMCLSRHVETFQKSQKPLPAPVHRVSKLLLLQFQNEKNWPVWELSGKNM